MNRVAIVLFSKPRRSAKIESLEEQQRAQQQIREPQQQRREQQAQQRTVQRQSATTTPSPVAQITEKQIRQRQQARANYHEDEYEPASEVESDRQQRVYRGQPSTIGQVQRDRDGLRRNVISVSLLRILFQTWRNLKYSFLTR